MIGKTDGVGVKGVPSRLSRIRGYVDLERCKVWEDSNGGTDQREECAIEDWVVAVLDVLERTGRELSKLEDLRRDSQLINVDNGIALNDGDSGDAGGNEAKRNDAGEGLHDI